MSARRAAVRVLGAIDEGRATLPSALDRERRTLNDERDRALLMDLASGVLRWRAELDALLAQCSTRPIADMEPAVLAVLRLGAYQFQHLERVPPHAIVHESVEIVRELGHPRAAGFVNAVLREFARRQGALRLPRADASAARGAQLAYLATTLSHPEWLVARWLDRVGFASTEAWCRFNNQVPAMTVRGLTGGLASETLAALNAAGATPARFVAGAFQLPPGALQRLPDDVRRQLFIQDEASQVVAHAVGASGGDRILDLCAAPGGKTVLIASGLDRNGRVVACDVRPARARVLKATLAAARIAAPVVVLDGSRTLPFAGTFDRVFVDAPCSGLGTLSRDPDLKWTTTASTLATRATAQRAILAQAARVVGPGGRLIYATCSSEPEENDDVIVSFLSGHPEFERTPIEPAGVLSAAGSLVDSRGVLRTLPFRDGLDAFFAVALCRRRM